MFELHFRDKFKPWVRICVPGSGTSKDGAVEQAEGQWPCSAHRQDDGVQGGQDVALCVVGLQGLGQLGEGRHILHRRTASWMDEKLERNKSVTNLSIIIFVSLLLSVIFCFQIRWFKLLKFATGLCHKW